MVHWSGGGDYQKRSKLLGDIKLIMSSVKDFFSSAFSHGGDKVKVPVEWSFDQRWRMLTAYEVGRGSGKVLASRDQESLRYHVK